MKHRFHLLAWCALVALGVVSCGRPVLIQPTANPDLPVSSDQPAPAATEPPASGGAVEIGLAMVDGLDFLIMESMPVQVSVVARGSLPDGCTAIGQAATQREENTFVVTLTTVRPVDAICTQALVPYEHTVPLDVVGLPAGTYTVTVNGVSGTFDLAADNVLDM